MFGATTWLVITALGLVAVGLRIAGLLSMRNVLHQEEARLNKAGAAAGGVMMVESGWLQRQAGEPVPACAGRTVEYAVAQQTVSGISGMLNTNAANQRRLSKQLTKAYFLAAGCALGFALAWLV